MQDKIILDDIHNWKSCCESETVVIHDTSRLSRLLCWYWMMMRCKMMKSFPITIFLESVVVNVDTWPAADTAATVTDTWDVMDQLMDNVCVNC